MKHLPFRIQTVVGVIFAVLSVVSIAIANETNLERELNQKAYRAYDAIQRLADTLPESKKLLRGMPSATRQRLYRFVYNHPVARLDRIPFYEPFPNEPTKQLGYCFGRAMTAHLIARRLGLPENKIRKLFVIGDMKVWRFHVTTIVQGTDGAWYAIDPITPSKAPYPVANWIRFVNDKFVEGRRANFYMVPAASVIPDVTTVPKREEGKLIIEISFEPTGKPGFLPPPEEFGELPSNVFNVQESIAPDHFITVRSHGEKRFSFLGINVNGERFNYHRDPNHRYFIELLDNIERTQSVNLVERRLGVPTSGLGAPEGKVVAPNPLGSPTIAPITNDPGE